MVGARFVLGYLVLVTTVSLCCGLDEIPSLEQSFKEWFEDNGGSFNKIDLFQSDSMGRGLVATSDVQANDEIIKVPANLVFSMKTLRQATDPILAKLAESFEPETALATWLLYEKCKGDESFFKPYIEVLPSYISSLMYFNAEELQELENPDFLEEALLMQHIIDKEHALMTKNMSPLWRGLPLSCISKSEFQWALSVLNSRGLRFQGQLYLTPLADMFNHEPHPDPRVSQNGKFFLQHHMLGGEGGVVVSSDRFQAKGVQVYEDYGDNNDETYLKYHGFVAAHNPFRCVKINTSEWTSAEFSALSSAKQKLITSFEFKVPPSHCIASNGAISKSVVVYAAIMAFTDHETSLCARIIKKKHSKSWDDIFKGCGLTDLNSFVNSLTSETSSKIDVVAADSDFDDIPLNQRVLAVIQKGISLSSSFRVATSIDDDKLILNAHQKLADQLKRASTAADSSAAKISHEHSNWHKIQAVNYRLLRKLHWKDVCAQYAANCAVLDGRLERIDISAYTAKISFDEPVRIHEAQRLSGTSAASSGKALDDSSGNTVKNGDTTAEISSLGEVLHVTSGGKALPVAVATDTGARGNDADDALQAMLNNFNAWFNSYLPESSKLAAAIIPGFRIGTVATTAIKAEEVYLAVPEAVILSADTAARTASSLNTRSALIGKLIVALREKFKFGDDFHELLVFLLYEYHVLGEQSIYWPYLTLLPKVDELDIPLMWSADKTTSLIKSSVLYDTVVEYQAGILRKFGIVSKVSLITDLFASSSSTGGNIFSFSNYRWATAIIDSRSIWWHGKRHLTPMLDFVNCMENSLNPSRIHSTKWDEEKNTAVTLADWNYEAGQQVFENYGQPNYIYFMYHGFVLANNSHDCVQFDLHLTQQEHAALDMNVNGFVFDRLRKNMQSSSHLGVCISYPLPEEVWLFLALKDNSVAELQSQELFGKPSKKHVTLLASLIDSKIAHLSDNISRSHTAAAKFLQSEVELLLSINSALLSGLDVNVGLKPGVGFLV